jgi:hypothetical protein
VRNVVRGRRRRVGPSTSCPTLPASSAERAKNSTEGIPGVPSLRRRYRPGGLRHGSLKTSPSSWKRSSSMSQSGETRRRRKTPRAPERRGGSGQSDSRYVASECFEEWGNVTRGGSFRRSTARSLNPSKERQLRRFRGASERWVFGPAARSGPRLVRGYLGRALRHVSSASAASRRRWGDVGSRVLGPPLRGGFERRVPRGSSCLHG